MNIELKASYSGYKAEAEEFLNSMLINYGSNFQALYAKSLFLYGEGKIVESAIFFKKAMELDPKGHANNSNELKEHLIDLLQPKSPTKVDILDVLKKRFDKNNVPPQLNLTVPRNEISSSQFTPSQTSSTAALNTENNKKKYFCITCNKGFTRMFGLKRHMLTHSGEKNHSCRICSRSFIQKSDLTRHEAIHNPSFDVACIFIGCDKRFKTAKNMRSHLLTHSLDRHKCRFCHKEFKSKSSLQSHEKLHFEVRPFICKCCDKGFTSNNYLKSHQKVHDNDIRFSCPICPEKTFKRKYDMRFHLKTSHTNTL